MEYEILCKMSPTRRSLEIARDILMDGEVHTKKEVFQQMRKELDKMGFSEDNANHIQNGFYAAVRELDCKVSHGVYHYTSSSAIEKECLPMSKDIEHGQQGMEYCKAIKDSIDGLCRILDLSNDTFDETSRLENYKAIFRKADAWEKQYAEFIQEQGEDPVMEQSM